MVAMRRVQEPVAARLEARAAVRDGAVARPARVLRVVVMTASRWLLWQLRRLRALRLRGHVVHRRLVVVPVVVPVVVVVMVVVVATGGRARRRRRRLHVRHRPRTVRLARADLLRIDNERPVLLLWSSEKVVREIEKEQNISDSDLIMMVFNRIFFFIREN